MKLWRSIVVAAALVCAGAGASAFAGDPFEDATVAVRWKENAKALDLIASGAFDVNQQNSEGYTLLHFAADQNNLDIAKALLERGADPNIKTNSGSTAADMAYSGSAVLSAVLKAGGSYARNAPYTPAPVTASKPSKAPAQSKPATGTSTRAGKEDPRRKMCNARHYSSSALCSDSTCKMREYRKWQTCLKTGSYH